MIIVSDMSVIASYRINSVKIRTLEIGCLRYMLQEESKRRLYEE
jgi:hypothetical protein